MTNIEKELLLKDLCARLPYGIKVCSPDKKICSIWSVPTISAVSVINGSGQSSHPIEYIKPYLRPMSSMTEEEMEKYKTISIYGWVRESKVGMTDICPTIEGYDWLNAHHFDYHGLIEKGLALKAPEGMYNKY